MVAYIRSQFYFWVVRGLKSLLKKNYKKHSFMIGNKVIVKVARLSHTFTTGLSNWSILWNYSSVSVNNHIQLSSNKLRFDRPFSCFVNYRLIIYLNNSPLTCLIIHLLFFTYCFLFGRVLISTMSGFKPTHPQ